MWTTCQSMICHAHNVAFAIMPMLPIVQTLKLLLALYFTISCLWSLEFDFRASFCLSTLTKTKENQSSRMNDNDSVPYYKDYTVSKIYSILSADQLARDSTSCWRQKRQKKRSVRGGWRVSWDIWKDHSTPRHIPSEQCYQRRNHCRMLCNFLHHHCRHQPLQVILQ